MANDKDFLLKNAVEVGGPTKVTLGTITDNVLETAYNMAVASYDNVSFSISSQDTGLTGLTFNNTGTKLYIAGNSSDSIYQYSLSTAFDLSTASYDSVSLSVSSQDTNMQGLTFNNDGTKLYVVGNANDSIYQYSLSTAFDLSTASYDSVSFSVTSQETAPQDVRFNDDGTKMYVLGLFSNDRVYQYSLSTAFDLSTASYDSVSLSVGSEETNPSGMFFKPDGTKLYVGGYSNTTLYQYSMSTAYDLSTASYDSVSFSVGSEDSLPFGFAFSSDGAKMFMVGDTGDAVYQYTTASYADQIDLATGNYFADTPTGASTYTISNAGDVQSFQLEVTGGTEEVAQNFSTTLYTGNGGTQTITNGIDLAGDGGLVWIKERTGTRWHVLTDSERGVGSSLFSNDSRAEELYSHVTSLNSDGFGIQGVEVNGSGQDYVSWTFRKAPKFFTCLTYTGDGTSFRQIEHNLGGTVGAIIIKATNTSSNWLTYHKDVYENFPTSADFLYLNLTNSLTGYTGLIRGLSDTTFTVGNNSFTDIHVNQSGTEYVAYLFAHDTDASSLIKCGSFDGASNTEVDLGFEPQWILWKNSSGNNNWGIVDNMRGIPSGGNDAQLLPNGSEAETANENVFDLNPTGFTWRPNAAGNTYIYIAIRAASDLDLTWPSSIEWAGGIAPSAPATGETDVYTLVTDDGGTSYVGVKTADNLS